MLIVQICDFGEDGDAHYRLHAPSRFLGRLPGVTAIDCHFYHRMLPELTGLADVLVVQFVNDWELLALCARRRAAGKVTVFEANDYFFDLQPWSPIVARWQERTVQELYVQFLQEADAVQTSTEELGRRWRGRGARQVAVFPNHLTHLDPLPAERNPGAHASGSALTVGWAGSPGHFADWYHTVPHLARWLAKHPDVRLAVMTHELAKPFIPLPPERYQFANFGSLKDYLHFLRSIDIGLAPLLPSGYNRCRSDVKFLEYASQGAAGLFADLEPYRDSVVDGETGLLFRTPQQMIDGLERLYADPNLRLKLRRQAYDYVATQRMLTDHIGERLAWYQSLLPRPARTTTLPAAIEQTAVRQGGYLQMPAQQPEQTLLQALNKPKPAESSPVLAQLLERQPRYLVALQSLGQFLNDQRDHRNAVAVLEKAREIAPYSARTLSEIGRAWFRLNDDGRARGALDEALRHNPHYLPGWQYLLRLLSISNHPDGPRLAARAEELFPTCYPIALLGAQNYPPAQAVAVLLRVLERHAPGIAFWERPPALTAFRQTIMTVIQSAPLSAEVVTLLRRACHFFPESTRLAAELGNALIRSGQEEEGYQQHTRALALRREAILYQEEFPREEAPPYLWQFAAHIVEKEESGLRIED